MKSFEESLDELKKIVDKLESGNLPLEDSIKLFQQGAKLISYSHKELNEVEKSVQILMEGKDGEVEALDFDPQD